ncbi:hypothetical protein SAY86_007966 [Trapa natans]|uniref:Uncharacterized protein n=1 Tax=Trapa natans TaxID=22666 RepID=A0AAN7LPY5_TRANT|nr:hypothetical protein SAY86_007966 [Trapa natans]
MLKSYKLPLTISRPERASKYNTEQKDIIETNDDDQGFGGHVGGVLCGGYGNRTGAGEGRGAATTIVLQSAATDPVPVVVSNWVDPNKSVLWRAESGAALPLRIHEQSIAQDVLHRLLHPRCPDVGSLPDSISNLLKLAI